MANPEERLVTSAVALSGMPQLIEAVDALAAAAIEAHPELTERQRRIVWVLAFERVRNGAVSGGLQQKD